VKPKTLLILLLLAAVAVSYASFAKGRNDHAAAKNEKKSEAKSEMSTMADSARAEGKVGKIVKTDEQWKKELTPEQYRVLRQKGTEMAFTGKYWKTKDEGVYLCAACGLELFSSENKYDSGSGWPSYYQPIESDHVTEHTDRTLGMVRTEIECSRCGGHLGHVFTDGPKPTGLRYCISSAALEFQPKPKEESK